VSFCVLEHCSWRICGRSSRWSCTCRETSNLISEPTSF
jgi:hypothetical protein